MKHIKAVHIIFLVAFTITGCSQKDSESYPFYVGTNTTTTSEGIYKYVLHDDGTMDSLELSAKVENPNFLTLTDDRQFLLSVSSVTAEGQPDVVRSYKIQDNQLYPLSESSSAGAGPCFVSVNSEGYVLVANYMGGNLSLYQIDEKGTLTEPLDIKQHEGSGITSRQDGPHAHSAWFVPNTNDILGVDLGTNDLWIYSLDTKNRTLLPADPPKLPMEPGAGPRHLDFHPTKPWVYVVNELNGTVSLVTREEGNYHLQASFPTLPEDFEGENTCADIHISDDGKFLYASNRGHNSLAIFSINNKTGYLTPIGHQSVLGETPRNFAISPGGEYVLVANLRSDNIISFKRDKNTGLLEYVDRIDAPRPLCIKFL